MPKLYVISDVHGFYNEMREALDEAGFNPNDENSWLISLGDEMDRGPDPEKVINYLMGLPHTIFVKGNHTLLMEQLLIRGYPLQHDWSNGTIQSAMNLAPNAKTEEEVLSTAYMKTKPFFDKEIDYFETEHYVFCHSWIADSKDWRNASQNEWEKAMWGNPFDIASGIGNKTEKIIVHGHYHNSYWWSKQGVGSEWGNDACFDICEHDGCIGLDACTALSHKVNVLVIEDEFLKEN